MQRCDARYSDRPTQLRQRSRRLSLRRSEARPYRRASERGDDGFDEVARVAQTVRDLAAELISRDGQQLALAIRAGDCAWTSSLTSGPDGTLWLGLTNISALTGRNGLFKQQNSRTFTHHKTVPRHINRAASRLGIR